jgi:glycosyltransferase involved in cell wall biosynthesis
VVAEPFGIDDRVFQKRTDTGPVLDHLRVPARGPLLLFAGRCEPDKDLHRLLSVALKAGLLFPELRVVLASHHVDRAYASALSRILKSEERVSLVLNPTREQLAALYCAATLFATASTSHFETFGRAPAEAMACGTMAIAPRYDGFAEVLAQPGGCMVDLEFEQGAPRASEASFLRAIYEALSFPPRASGEEIARTAQHRFGRARTLRTLQYLASPFPQPEPSGSELNEGTAPCTLNVPDEWRAAMRRIELLNPGAALALLWEDRELRSHARHDETFRTSIRCSLAQVDKPDANPRGETCL